MTCLTYRSLIGITNIIGMVIFAVLSAVMSARFIGKEYMQEKGQFCCFPIPSPAAVLFLRKSEWYFSIRQPPCFYAGNCIRHLFCHRINTPPMCGAISAETIVYSLFSLICYSLLAGIMGIIALWFGFGRHSVTVTIERLLLLQSSPVR